MERFDLLTSPLRGRNLIEASAGTGKTFTIAGLFVRLLLENPPAGHSRPLSVNEILVVTFTEAATQELRDRIRRRIRDTLDAFMDEGGSGFDVHDPFLRGLLDRHRDRERARDLLFGALSSFDEAPVFTIHGFCQRMLLDNPFESGSLYDTRLVADSRAMYREIAEDFWRNALFSAPSPLVREALSEKMGPEYLLALARGHHPSPFLTILPETVGRLPEASGEITPEECREQLLAIKREFFRYLESELAKRKRRENVRFFDDLLLDLHGALRGERGDLLAAAVRTRFKAALIDEFQDTDPVQYAIFDRIFHDGETPLFLIGDPKQAIYSFRGADIFAYLAAAEGIAARHTLEENWRSEPALIRAVNTLFQRHTNPFLLEEIGFRPVRPAPRERQKLLTRDGKPDPAPLSILFVPRSKPGKPIDKQDAWELVPAAVAAEIARLLADSDGGRLQLDGRKVRPGDIAVLVRKNRQARLMERSLRERGIPCVLCRAGNLFESTEASEMLCILAAMAEPGSESLVKAALVTCIMGTDGTALAALLADDAAWETVLEEFRRYHDEWNSRGFMVMFMGFLAQRQVRTRLLRLPGGERALTNVMHCMELLHQAEATGSLGMEGLLAWLTERLTEDPKPEEYEIRLETDAEAVQLVTVHRSKGLEFPIVFCPFSWESAGWRGKAVAFHDREKRVVLDLGSPDLEEHRELAEREQLAEELRLLYVALTRAGHSCHVVWGAFKDAGASALHYLLHPERPLAKRQVSADDDELLRDLHGLAEESGNSIRVGQLSETEMSTYRPAEGAGAGCVARTFSGTIDNGWRVTSFTSFTAGSHHGDDHPDRDAATAPNPEEMPLAPDRSGLSIFDFPGGVKAGIFLHEILERLDFSAASAAEIADLVTECLERHGFEEKWRDTICRMIDGLLRLPLPGPSGPFSLSAIGPGDRISELEFYFPLKAVTADRVRDTLSSFTGASGEHSLAEVFRRLHFTPVKGMVRGFIDLVFRHDNRYYLVDWKSNHLGMSPDRYDEPNLRREMERRLYPFQYLLYTTALVNFLRRQVPGFDYASHFGGIYYLFLRGIDPKGGAGYGVYHDRPTADAIAALTECLLDREGCLP